MSNQTISIAEYRSFVATPFCQAGQAEQKRGRRRARPEEELHRACFSWVLGMRDTTPVLNYLFHVPNGGGRSAAEAGILKATGVMPGVPDFILPFPYLESNGLAIELKAGKNRLTPEQRGWLQNASRHQWVTGVARDLDDFKTLVNVFLGGVAGNKAGDNSGGSKTLLPGYTEIHGKAR